MNNHEVKKERIVYLDIVKAIAIILVIIGPWFLWALCWCSFVVIMDCTKCKMENVQHGFAILESKQWAYT